MLQSFSGLRGHVGVDLVLANDKPFVIDVNPRLTTSYVGLCRVATFNVAETLVDAVLKGKLPTKREPRGFVCFSKLETPKPTVDAFEKVIQIKEVVSPPFLRDNSDKACSLVAGYDESLDKAQLRFEEAKKRLLNIICRGK